MHIIVAGLDFNQCTIRFHKLADWGPTCYQPVALMHVTSMKYGKAQKLKTFGFVLFEPLVESHNGPDEDHST